jgi:hypothetical protein
MVPFTAFRIALQLHCVSRCIARCIALRFALHCVSRYTAFGVALHCVSRFLALRFALRCVAFRVALSGMLPMRELTDTTANFVLNPCILHSHHRQTSIRSPERARKWLAERKR